MRRPFVLVALALLVPALCLLGLTTAASASVPSQAPTALAPLDGDSVGTNPLFAWTHVPAATSYHIQISADPSFGSPVVDTQTLAARYTPDTDLPLGTLYWRVAGTGTGSGNPDGPFSSAVQFTKTWNDAPSLSQPSDGAALHFPTDPALFSWSPVPGASQYTLEIDNSSDFINASDYTTVNTSYTLTSPQSVGQTFYWRVRADATNGVVSQWSAVRSYSYSWNSKPTLMAPAPSQEEGAVTDVELRWSSIPGAASYEFQISPNGDWANNLTMDKTVHGTSYTLPSTLNNGSYFWRVRAADSAGDYGTWSDAGSQYPDSFTRSWPKAPVQIAPAWDPAHPDQVPHVPASLDMSWTPVDHAAYYQVQISNDVNFSPADVVSCYTNHTEWTPYLSATTGTAPGPCPIDSSPNTMLAVGTTYYWRVRGIDAPTGVLGTWSTPVQGPWRFVIDPAQPAEVNPVDGATVSVPTLSWLPVAHSQYYDVTILNSAGAAIVNAQQTFGTSYTPTQSALPNGTYTWYVQAVDGAGVLSPAPEINARRTFTLVAPTTSSSLTLTAPTDGASFNESPAMSWTPMTGASKYDVIVANNGFSQTLASNVPYPAYTNVKLQLQAGTYSWWVVAKDAQGGQIGTSNVQTFSMTSPNLTLGSGDYLPLGNCSAASVCADTPTFEWQPDPRAADYILTIANDPAFTNVVRQYTTAYSTFTPRDSLPDNQAGQAYYWFVRPCLDSQQTRCGPGPDDPVAGQNAGTFAKHSLPVHLVAPSDGATVSGSVTFRWDDYLTTGSSITPNAQQEAAQYLLQVSSVPDFSHVLDTETVDGTSYTPVNGYPNGPLYWRVQAIDGSGQLLTQSAAREVVLTAGAPNPIAPHDGAAVGGVPYLRWSTTPTAATYTVELYKNGDTQFSPGNRLLTATTTFSAWSPLVGLPSGNYAWRVRGIDGSGNPGPWSSGATFSLSATMPQPTGPTEHLTKSSDVLFSWTGVSGAASYRWQLASDIGFTHVVASATTVMTEWVPRTSFPDGTYFWRVVALDGSGNAISASTASTTWQITKDSVPPAVTALTPNAAADPTAGFTATFSEPVTGVGTSTFQVTPSGATHPTPGTVTVSSDDTSAHWQPATPLIAGQMYAVSLKSEITDAAGNPLTEFDTNVRTATTIENGASGWAERWARVTTSKALGGSYDWSDMAGATITLPFSGSTVTVLGTKSRAGGYASISIDGVQRAAKVSFHAAATKYRASVWSISSLGAGAHVVTIKALGTAPAGATGHRVAIDAVRVGAVTTDQSSSQVRETLRRVRSSSSSGGSYDTTSFATSAGGTGPSYTVTFRGTSLTLYGVMSPSSGSAAVFIDGSKRGKVSLQGSTTIYRYPVFSSSGLTDKVHTVRVSLVGTKTGKRSSVGLDSAVTS